MDNSKYLKLLAEYDVHCQHVIKSTIMDVGESVADKNKRIAKTEKKYTGWFEYYFPHYAKVPCADFHDDFANAVIKDKKIKLLWEAYRSSAKSVHADMGMPLFLYLVLGEMPFMLLMGETETKSKQLLSDIQAELQYNQRLINDYGNKFKAGDWADGNFYTTDGVRFMALGFGQSPRGLREGAQRPAYIVLDDTDTKKHINNDRIMGEAVDFILEEVLGCFDSADSSIERLVFANNNFHKNGITNRLKEKFKHFINIDKEAGDKSQYKILTVCAVKDLINFEPTWPAKTSAKYWKNKYTKNPRAFLREYMHVHVSEGKIFMKDMMQWKDMLRLAEYDALIFIGDLSYKDLADFKSMFLLGKKGKEYHIIHSFLRQTSRQIVAEWLYDIYEERNLANQNIDYKIDGLFAQDEFTSDFDAEGDERGYYIPVVANVKSYGNKFDHIESALGRFIRRWVFWNEKEKDLPDQVEAIEQFLSFEKGSGTHDDGPDAIVVGMKELDKATFVEKFEAKFSPRKILNKRY